MDNKQKDKKEKPIISVIITTYNRYARLKKAIQSVLEQTYQDYEIIIVDDASTDKTEDIVKDIISKNPQVIIKYIKRETNWGCHSRPKNDGIKAAESKYIAYLDDDNIWYKDHLQALYKDITDTNKPPVDMVYGDRRVIEEGLGGLIHKQMADPVAFDWHPILLRDLNFIDTGDVLMTRESVMAVGGWDEGLKKFADWNLWVRFAKAGYSARRTRLILSEYRIHSGMAQKRHQSLVGPNGEPLPTFDATKVYIWPDKTLFGLRPNKKVAIITITWNRLEYLRRTIKSMRKTAGYEFDHYIVDNGSDREQRSNELLEKDKYFYLDKNYGVPYAYNYALNHIDLDKYDLIILTDNDCEFISQGWLKEIVDLYQRETKIIVSPYVEGLSDNPGGGSRAGHFYVGEHYLGATQHMGNICQVIPIKFFNDKWRFDVHTFKHGTQSHQVAREAARKGYMLAYLEDIKVEHMDTTQGQRNKDPEYIKLSGKMKTEKYKPEITIQKELKHIDENDKEITFSVYWEKQKPWVKKAITFFKECGVERILDVGCGFGEAMEEFQKQGYKTQGIDIHKKRLEVCRQKGLEVKELDMESMEDSVEAIYTYHALEHSVDLKKVMAKLLASVKVALFIVVPQETSQEQRLNPLHNYRFSTLENLTKYFDEAAWEITAEVIGQEISIKAKKKHHENINNSI